MKSFTDTNGREWNVAITIGTVKRVTAGSKGEVNLLSPHEPGAADAQALFARLTMNVELFVDTLYLLCESQAKELGVTDEAFGGGLSGDVIFAAREAFFSEWISFFEQLHQPANAAAIRRAVELVQNARDRLAAEIQSADLDNPPG